MIRLRLLGPTRPALKLKALPRFPVSDLAHVAAPGLKATLNGRTVTHALDLEAIPQNAAPPDFATRDTVVFETVTKTVERVPLSTVIASAVATIRNGVAAALDTLAEVATELALKAPLASPALTGSPTAPTPAADDNDTSIATTAYVQTEIAGTMDGNARVAVKKAGSVIGTRRGVNLIEGANVTLTVADDAANEEVDVTIAVATAAGLPRGYLAGLTLANNVTDAVNDIDVAAGAARDDANGNDLITTATIVKQIDVVFAEYAAPGTPSGGRASADNLTGAKWFHVFMIGGSGKNTQPFFATSLSPTLPTGFTFKRRIGSVNWTGSTILAFKQDGDEFLLNTPVADINTSTLSTTAVLFAVTVPDGVKVRAIVDFSMFHATSSAVLISSPDQADTAPAVNGIATMMSVNAYSGSGKIVRTDTSRRIRARASAASTNLFGTTNGWLDRRGRDD